MASPNKKSKSAAAAYETRLFINNEFVNSISGKTFPCYNPTTEEVLCQVQEAAEEDVNKAVAAAKKAFHPSSEWRTMTGAKRRDLMLKFADLLERDKDELATIETMNNGKPLAADGKTYGSHIDMHLIIECVRYYAGFADKITGQTVPTDSKNLVYTRKEPVGVVGAIVAWNFPLLLSVGWKLSPALASGCTIVIKTSEKTPLSLLAVCKLIKEAGFPPGVVNVISGYGPTTGSPLVRHPDVDKVSFTGSTGVGKEIMRMAADTLKRVTLELGGKSPLIICDDADLDDAVKACNTGIFLNHGQCCCASSRTFVQAGIYDKFMKRMVEVAKARRLGDPLQGGIEQGPLVDDIQFKRVLGFIEKGKQEGATVMCGGGRFGTQGYFVEPTIFTDVKDDMTIAREEIFGPVLSVMKFNTIDEVIERANDTIYGLAAGVCSRDIGKVMKISEGIRAGTIWVNGAYNTLQAGQNFGGFKQSGLGRELGEHSLNNFLEVKTVVIPMDR